MSIALSFKELDATVQVNPDFVPRWYQEEAIQALFSYDKYKEGGHPLIEVPTGGGKSHICALFCKRVLEAWPDQRILVLSHVDTILEQDYLTLREHLPSGRVGLFSAGFGRKERRAVTVAGIQSIYKKVHLFESTTLIIVDEAHTIPVSGEGQYRSFLKQFKCPIIGLTATPFRLGSGYLHEGDGRIFTDIAYTVDINKLIEQGFLSKLIPREPSVLVDMDGVATQGGDFSKRETVERLDREGLTADIIKDLVQYKETYKKWLIFAIDIEHAELIATALNNEGVDTAVVHSKQSKGLNNGLKLDFKRGYYQALVSVESLTTGFDVPSVDLIALVRPTKSPVLHIQMIGRGLRIAEGKDHCLVLDYAGNVARLGPINDVQIATRKKKGKGAGITKTCPDCKTICAGSAKFCPTCGMEFTFKEKIAPVASTSEIIAKKKREKKKPNEPYWAEVKLVTYNEYIGKYGVSMLITYRCGLRTYFEYKKFDEGTKAGYNSQYWWRHRAVDKTKPPPKSTQEAVIRANAGDLQTPYAIFVLERGKYPEIQKALF